MKSQVEITNAELIPEKRLFDIPVGTYFTGRVGEYPDRLFAVLFSLCAEKEKHIVSLSNLNNTWSGNTLVRDYRPVNVKITITGDAA